MSKKADPVVDPQTKAKILADVRKQAEQNYYASAQQHDESEAETTLEQDLLNLE